MPAESKLHRSERSGLPIAAGIGLKFAHLDQFLQQRPDIGFVEVHAENYLVDGGVRLAQLDAIRADYPLSIHGVAASLGGQQGLDQEHLRRLKRLIDRYQPEQFSEHLAWSNHDGYYFNDLLPVPYTPLLLQRVSTQIDQLQNALGRTLLLENPATYLDFADSTLDESDFLRQLCAQTGCGLLLDLSNLVVSCTNRLEDPLSYLRQLPLESVGEIHLAGFAQEWGPNGQRVLIDSHSCDVSPEVWQLYQAALELTGPQPTLLERDANLPPLERLIAEAKQAQPYLEGQRGACVR